MLRCFAIACAMALPAAAVLAEAICPLPEGEVQKAVRAFSEMSRAFKDRRCTNCHGAVNPFAANGGHAGGVITLANTLSALGASRAALVEALTRANGGRAPSAAAIADAEAVLRTFRSTDGPLTDRGAIADIVKAGGLENVAYAPCAECHQNPAAPWQLATSLWSDKSEEALCEFFQRTMDASGFLQHATDDRLGFVQAGFAGTRGLTEFGRAFLKGQTGRDYAPEPPTGLTAAGLTGAANRWIEALGGRFHTPPSCGCRVEKYRLIVKEAGDNRVTLPEGLSTHTSRGEASIDLEFGPDGSVHGQGNAIVEATDESWFAADGFREHCRSDWVSDHTFDVSGTLDEATGTFALKVTINGLSRSSTMICEGSGGTRSLTFPAIRVDPETLEVILPAELNTPKAFVFPVDDGAMSGAHSAEMQIVRR